MKFSVIEVKCYLDVRADVTSYPYRLCLQSFKQDSYRSRTAVFNIHQSLTSNFMRNYTGIGSRSTPESVKPLIKHIVEHFNSLNYMMRSGAANGADKYFEEYAKNTEIYLPWAQFNGSTSLLYPPTPVSYQTAEKFHPYWHTLKPGAKSLMARNVHQVLGYDLQTPSDFVLCWTSDGKASGGTGQAMRIARYYKIPVVNLNVETHVQSLFSKFNIKELVEVY